MSSNATMYGHPFDPLQYGFDFSLTEYRAFGEAVHPFRQVTGVDLDFPTWLANHRAAQREVQTH